MDTHKFDIVLSTLQTQRDKLWDLTKDNVEWGIMDQIRLKHISELEDAMDVWLKYKPKDDE